MRDQMIGLSYALLITGFLLTPLQYAILDTQTFWRVSPFLFGPIILGAGGLYWFKIRVADEQLLAAETPAAAEPPSDTPAEDDSESAD